MNLIFSADCHWGIGRDNGLLFKCSGDMKFFRTTTLDKVVVMGRRTLESLPGGKPLPKRVNIVLTGSQECQDRCEAWGADSCVSIDNLFDRLAEYSEEDVFIIGGEQVYRQLMPYCRRAYITKFDGDGHADAFVPDFDAEPGWRLESQSEMQEENGLGYRFCTYVQDEPTSWGQ